MRRSSLALLVVLLAPMAAGATPAVVTIADGTYAVTSPDGAGGHTTRLVAFDAGGYELDGTHRPLAPPPVSSQSNTRIAFLADIGMENTSRKVIAAIIAQKPDLVLIGGDLSYAHGDRAQWDRWTALMTPLTSTVPTLPAFGNHEAYCQGNGTTLLPCGPAGNQWNERFRLPNVDKLYYRVDWGPARITVLDTEAYAGNPKHPTNASQQERYLSDSMAGAGDRWNLVMYHRPLQTTNSHDGDPLPKWRASLAATLDAKADLVLQAHIHAYERAKPNENGVVYVTSGGGGRPVYDEWTPMEPWVAMRAAEHHFLLLDMNATRIEGRAIRPDGSILDTFSLERRAPAPPTPTPSPTPATPTQPTPPTLTPTPATPTPTPIVVSPSATPGEPAPAESRQLPLHWALVVVGVTLSARLIGRRARG